MHNASCLLEDASLGGKSDNQGSNTATNITVPHLVDASVDGSYEHCDNKTRQERARGTAACHLTDALLGGKDENDCT